MRLLLMEAAERHSSVFVGTEQFRLAQSGELPRSEMSSLLQYSEAQLCSRSDAVPLEDPWWVPEPISNQARIRWQEARSLLSGEACYVPAGFVYLGYGSEDEPLYALADSTGCAASSTRQEAICRALLEVVERDALGIWWYNRVCRPAFDCVDEPALASIAGALDEIGRSLVVIDITTDMGVPVVAAYSADRSGHRIYLGCAADICKRAAAVRAASEMLQFWFWGTVSRDPQNRIAWLEQESIDTQSWLSPGSVQQLPEAALEKPVSERLEWLISQITNRGYDPLWVDLTRPWIGTPVVRVLVPGLRSHQPRFAPGRLFDVPLQLGWLSEKREESQLLRYACPV